MREKIKKIGLDEAGRGALAGPVVAAAVALKGFRIEAKDSKKLPLRKRKMLYEKLTSHSEVEWSVGLASPEEIDRINILQATRLAMKRALAGIDCSASHLLIDGNFLLDVDMRQKAVIRGDERIPECSAASVIAKVKRDEIMEEYHGRWSSYGFSEHKGYGTKAHKEALGRYGACPIHRTSFKLRG